MLPSGSGAPGVRTPDVVLVTVNVNPLCALVAEDLRMDNAPALCRCEAIADVLLLTRALREQLGEPVVTDIICRQRTLAECLYHPLIAVERCRSGRLLVSGRVVIHGSGRRRRDSARAERHVRDTFLFAPLFVPSIRKHKPMVALDVVTRGAHPVHSVERVLGVVGAVHTELVLALDVGDVRALREVPMEQQVVAVARVVRHRIYLILDRRRLQPACSLEPGA